MLEDKLFKKKKKKKTSVHIVKIQSDHAQILFLCFSQKLLSFAIGDRSSLPLGGVEGEEWFKKKGKKKK